MALTPQEWFSVIVSVLLVALFLHFAARFVAKGARYTQSIAVAVLSGFLSALALFFIEPRWLAYLVAVVAFLAVAGTIYRIGWLRALILGFLAWVLFVLVNVLIDLVVRAVTT